jgi:predicted deacylase
VPNCPQDVINKFTLLEKGVAVTASRAVLADMSKLRPIHILIDVFLDMHSTKEHFSLLLMCIEAVHQVRDR